MNEPEYIPEDYWSRRAIDGAETSFLKPVMVANATERENAAMDRVQRKMMDVITAEMDLKGKRVLEIGCGVGRWFPYFESERGAEWHGVDISADMIALAKGNFPEIRATTLNSHQLPFPDGSFDLVYSVTVIHHNPYPDQEAMMAEMVRVLRPSGRFLLFEDLPIKSRASNMFPRKVAEWVGLGERFGLRAGNQQLGGYLPIKRGVMKVARTVLAKSWQGDDPTTFLPPLQKMASFADYYLDPFLLSVYNEGNAATVLIDFQKA